MSVLMVAASQHSSLRITQERVQVRKVDLSILVHLLARPEKRVHLFEDFGAHVLVCDGNSSTKCLWVAGEWRDLALRETAADTQTRKFWFGRRNASPDVVVDQELLETRETGIGATVHFVHKSREDWLVWAEELNNRVHDGILEIGRLQVLAHEVSTKELSSRRHGSRVLIVSIIGKLLHSNIRWVDCRLVDIDAFKKISAGHRYRNVLKGDKVCVLEPQHIVSEYRCVEAVDRDTPAFQTVGEKTLIITTVSSVLVDVIAGQETKSVN
jgi:hypothetical protein